jgi:hypothetical protein
VNFSTTSVGLVANVVIADRGWIEDQVHMFTSIDRKTIFRKRPIITPTASNAFLRFCTRDCSAQC